MCEQRHLVFVSQEDIVHESSGKRDSDACSFGTYSQ